MPRRRSTSGSKPSRMNSPSRTEKGGSSHRVRPIRSVRSSRVSSWASSPRRPRSKADSSSFTWGSRAMAFFRATTSRPPAVPYTMRPTSRSMSPMPDRARASSSRTMVWSTSWPTAALRRVMAVTDSRGRSSQLRSSRPPMGVRVLSSTQRRLPFFSLLRRVSVSSRFRRAVRSSSINCPC